MTSLHGNWHFSWSHVVHFLPLAVTINYVSKGRLNFMGLPIPTYLDYCSRTAVSDEHERSASSAKNSVSGQPGYHQQAVEFIIKKKHFFKNKKKIYENKKVKKCPFF